MGKRLAPYLRFIPDMIPKEARYATNRHTDVCVDALLRSYLNNKNPAMYPCAIHMEEHKLQTFLHALRMDETGTIDEMIDRIDAHLTKQGIVTIRERLAKILINFQ